jgi:hypothetical protein
MLPRFIAALVVASLSLAGVHSASAQEVSLRPLQFASADTAVAASASLAADEIAARETQLAYTRAIFEPKRPSGVLQSLMVTSAVMHALDVHSTISVMRHGGAEGNPLLTGIVANKGAFIAFKAGVATASILAAKSLAKRNKVAAIATMVGINSAYAMVVSHNYKLARQLKQAGF